MQPEPFQVDEPEEEDLPDLAGLAPVRSLAQLKAVPTRAPREKLTPTAALSKYWGYHEFRPLQAEAVASALAGRDCMIVLPTGGGKSLCYQVPAACGAGAVLVVSPLIALMDDQVASAREAGLSAAALHGNLDESERRRARDLLAAGALDLLYVSPERLCVGDLVPVLAGKIALAAVDEAHCVSHWGHDFRPEYRKLAPILDQLRAPRMGLTATATPQVQDDICKQLGLRQPVRLVGHVDRPNLVYRSLPRQSSTKQAIEVIRRHPGEGGIVYAQTRREVERLAAALQKERVHCAAYHAGLPAQVRSKVQSDFVNERLDVVCATVAFGMGIDRSNVRYVVHANTPKSIEHYQQEAGRAGRDGLPAECVLLYSGADLVTHRALAAKDGPLSPDRARALDRQLRDIGRFAVSPVCRHRLLTEHFGQPYPAPTAPECDVRSAACGVEADTPHTAPRTPHVLPHTCGACDVCLGETEELAPADALVTAQKIISAVWRLNGRFGAGHVVDVVTGKRTDKVARGGHDQLSVFGLLADAGEQAVRAWIDQLAVQGHVAVVEDGVYSFLTMTEVGRGLCKGDGAVRLGRPVAKSKPARASRRGDKGVKSGSDTSERASSGADDALFERLRALRRRLAERLGVPPYLVFTDVTLRALASERPATLEAMRGIKGIGETKLARYGNQFLPVIRGEDPDLSEAGT